MTDLALKLVTEYPTLGEHRAKTAHAVRACACRPAGPTFVQASGGGGGI